MKTILIAEDFRDYLESLHFEANSRKNLVVFMLSTTFEFTSPIFAKIYEEYQEFYVQYQIAKKSLEDTYLKPMYTKVPKWHLDFQSREIVIDE